MTGPRVRLAAVLWLVTVLLLGVRVPAAAQVGVGVAGDAASERSAPQVGYPCADPANWDDPGCAVGDGGGGPVGRLVGAGLSSVFDGLYEWVASGAAWLLGRLAGLIDSSTRPRVDAGWFARQYRLMGTLAAALVTPLLLIATLSAVVRSDLRGLFRSYLVYLPAAMVGAAVAVPLVDLALDITDWMSSLFLGGLRGDVDAFTAGVTDTLTTATSAAGVAGGGVAPFLLFIGAAVIALGAFAVWVELVLRAAGIYVALFFLPLGFAALVWPSTRGWFARLVKALAALILSKFVIVAVIALAAGALGDLDDGGGFSGVIAGAALMLMAAFSPVVLFRLADVAGDEMAAAVGGVTQQRTSPVPTPAPTQSAAALYGRIMHTRGAADTAGSTGAATTRAAPTGGPAGVAEGDVADRNAPAVEPAASGRHGPSEPTDDNVPDGAQSTPGDERRAASDAAASTPTMPPAEPSPDADEATPVQQPQPAVHADTAEPVNRPTEAPAPVSGSPSEAAAPLPAVHADPAERLDHPTQPGPPVSGRPTEAAAGTSGRPVATSPEPPPDRPADRPLRMPSEPPSPTVPREG